MVTSGAGMVREMCLYVHAPVTGFRYYPAQKVTFMRPFLA